MHRAGLFRNISRLERNFTRLTVRQAGNRVPSGEKGPLKCLSVHDREPGRIAEDPRPYKAMGVDEVVFDFRSPPVPKTIANMDHFMKEVAPLVT